MGYGWSLDEEHYYGGKEETREAALAMGRRDEPFEEVIYTARAKCVTIDGFLPDADDIIDWMLEHNEEEMPDGVGDDWLGSNVTREQKEELTASVRYAIRAWAEKHGHHPDWWIAEDVQRHRFAPALPAPAPEGK